MRDLLVSRLLGSCSGPDDEGGGGLKVVFFTCLKSLYFCSIGRNRFLVLAILSLRLD